MQAGNTRQDLILRILQDVVPIRTVDVGANPIGRPASYADLLKSGALDLLGFEPQEDALATLRAQASEAETYLPHAIGSGAEETLHICQNAGFTSLFQPDPVTSALLGNAGATRIIETRSVKTRRLDDLAEVPRIDFLKIDIQGGELKAIRGGQDKLAEAVLIQTEVRFFPLYLGEPSYGELEAELAAQGFRLHSFTVIKKTTQASTPKKRMRKFFYSQLVDGDAFFVRDLRGVDDFSAVQLGRLAILAESVMGACDLVLFCLEKLFERGVLKEQDALAYQDLLPDRMLR